MRYPIIVFPIVGVFAWMLMSEAAFGRGVAQLLAVEASSQGNSLQVRLQFDDEISYAPAMLSNPDRWYVDFQGAEIGRRLSSRQVAVGTVPLRRVRWAQNSASVVRVVFDLTASESPEVSWETQGRRMTVRWSVPVAAGGFIAAGPAKPIRTQASEPMMVSPRDQPNRTVFSFETPVPPKVSVVERGSNNPLPMPEINRLDPAPVQLLPSVPRVTSPIGTLEVSEEPPIVTLPPVSFEPGRYREWLGLLAPGRRIRIEGRKIESKALVARSIEFVSDDDEYEIEGPISRYKKDKGSFSIGLIPVVIYERTRFEDSRRASVSPASLRNGLRVKVKGRRFAERQLKARTIRIYEGSDDTGFEIEAPVESVSRAKSEIEVLSARVRVESKTRFENLPVMLLAEYPAGSRNGYLRRDDDEQTPNPIRIGPVYLGGRTSSGWQESRNIHLGGQSRERDVWLRPATRVEAALPLGESFEAYAKIDLSQGIYRGDGAGERVQNTYQQDFRVREAFLYIRNFIHPSLALQVGRQRFRDRREWLYDDELDAVRLHFTRSKFKLEMSVAKGLFGPTGSRSDQYHYTAYSQYQLPGKRSVSAYVMKRNDLTARDEDPLWYGFSSRGRAVKGLEYWAEYARRRGRRESRLLRGWGLDVGASLRLPILWNSTLAGGYAYGSGDNDLDDGVDENFRQTSLNDNSDRHGSLRRYRYYGVLLAPELSNMRIRTLDYGIRPGESWSLNLVLHDYRQAVASKKVGDWNLGVRPSGQDRRLGKEIDAVFTLRRFARVDIGVVGGLFIPGPAFRGTRGRALVLHPEIVFYF